jgi:hypothetical protein
LSVSKKKRASASRGPHDALVARHDVGGVREAHVRDDQETVRQPAAGVEQREVLLVLPHRQDEAFLRHGEEGFLELARVHRREFHQRGDFVQQRREIRLRAERCTEGGGLAAQGRIDRGPAFGERGDDLPALHQHRDVGVDVGDLDVARALESMALRDAAGREPEHRHRHHIFSVQGNQSMGGTHEVHGGLAVGQLVAHDLRDRQLGDAVQQRCLQTFRESDARQAAFEEHVLGVAFHAALAVARGGAFLLEPLRERGRRRAGSIEADLRGHQLLRLGAIGRLVGDVLDAHREAARCGVGRDRRIGGGEAAGDEARLDAVRERAAEPLERLGREFLGEEFDEQGTIHAAAFARCAIGKPSRSRDS